MKIAKFVTLTAISTAAIFYASYGQAENVLINTRASLGERLFNDRSLSKDGTQSCATCHDSQYAFIDSRPNIKHQALATNTVSKGQDERSLGDINTPSAAYAAYTPAFHFDQKEELYMGGLFLNGRAADLKEQAKQPFLNPLEMQSTRKEVVAKVKARYAESLHHLYGTTVFDSTESAFDAIADSIAAFERSERFAPFDSRFDRVLRGEASYTAQEQRGHDLFVDEKKANCAACHPVPELNSSKQDSLFTDFTYDNLGAPANKALRTLNGKGDKYVDNGLYANPEVNDPELKGAFRVSSLRNIAVTGPYMHNGVFRELKTVISFYNSRDVAGALNPETGKPWRDAEIDATKNTEELGDLNLTEDEIDDLVAFMKTLTDQRYEHLIP